MKICIMVRRSFAVANHIKKYVSPSSLANPSSKGKSDIKPFYPRQHWQPTQDQGLYIIPYSTPVKPLTPYGEIPQYAKSTMPMPFVSPTNSKILKTAIIGPANSGKSLLFNTIIKKAASLSSSKRGSTFQNTIGIATDSTDNTQFEIMDTVGAVRATSSIRSTRVLTKFWDELIDYDIALFVIDGVKRVDVVAKESVKRLKSIKILPKNTKLNAKDVEGKDLETELESMQSILIVNKVDLVVNKKKMKEIVAEIEDIGNFNKTHYISALTGFGIEELIKDLKSYTYEHPWNYNPNYVTPSSDASVVHQIIKKSVFDSSYKEIPYIVGIKIQSWVCMSNGEIHIECDLLTNTKVQKAMLTGSNGRKAKEMATQCEAEIAAYLQRPVKLLLCIKQSKYKREGQEAPFYEEDPAVS